MGYRVLPTSTKGRDIIKMFIYDTKTRFYFSVLISRKKLRFLLVLSVSGTENVYIVKPNCLKDSKITRQ